MPYTIEDHKHRLAAWDAASSASASPVCRFKVQTGLEILEACGFDAAFAAPDQLPEPTRLDGVHLRWREAVIEEAKRHGLKFTHGIAAKLINSYLKSRFVCGGHHNHERVKCLHPPIDAVLLGELAELDIGGHAAAWRAFHQARWSKFDSETYEAVISLIRKALPAHEPLWKIEEYWQGHQ